MLLWPTLTNGSLMVTDPRLTLMTVQSGTVSEPSSAWMIFRGSNLIIKSNKMSDQIHSRSGFRRQCLFARKYQDGFSNWSVYMELQLKVLIMINVLWKPYFRLYSEPEVYVLWFVNLP